MTKHNSNAKRSSKRKPRAKKRVNSTISNFNFGVINHTIRKTGNLQCPVIMEKCSVTNSSSSVGGTIADVVPVSIANLNHYSSIASMWDEYRILSATLHYAPEIISATSANASVDGLVVVDYDNSTALASYSSAFDYDNVMHWYPLNGPLSIRYVASKLAPDNEWYNTSSPTVVGWFKFYATGLSISQTYGRYYLTIEVQYRGHV